MSRKLNQLLLWLSLTSSSVLLPAYPHEAAPPKCTSAPCGNTATGEDPQQQRLREAGARSEALRGGDDDQQRWSSIRLYSDSTKPERLTMPVMKAAGLAMHLDPKSGQLSFSKPGARHTFSIVSPAGDKNSVCPEYTIQIIEASPVHALVRMSCLQVEYAPGRYHMGVDYYLYDAETAVMRSIWRTAVNDRNARMPDTKPPPSLKIIPNGYRFDWAGVPPSNSKMSTTVLRNSYTRQTGKTGGMILLCTNLSAPNGQGVEDEMCEGAVLTRIRDSKDSKDKSQRLAPM
ncbi:hypothetical protein [Duganella aceris]|uniref:Uncharacterized protein n=1 Tax=Duganella aceris TaxID=2703883 RepID=A0ABX0FSI3_9BURK|nr:hypothetical protein [Duganella aceris]NGZ87434.1 hypothetical protein [Duganella aceris]